ncbi:MAG: hypothetical protein IID33_02535 [Planctomycetes bacterium]|nr:hypothetical protein [Planctomycetota bacterium]
MSDAPWIRVKLSKSTQAQPDQSRGVNFSVQISPYDLPQAIRGRYVDDRGVLRIEFRYPDEEPACKKRVDDCVSVELGEFSQKLLAIEVAVDDFGVESVQLTIKKADETVRRLQDNVKFPSARLNYRAVDEVLQLNRNNPELFAIA